MHPFNHIMIDLETMGVGSFSAIVSIGALEFDITTGKTGKEFYVNVDLQSCVDAGLVIDVSTVLWWLKQDKQAKESLINNPVPIKEALSLFSTFCTKYHQVWGNSARFDLGILNDAYNKVGIPIPWDYRNERCVRTLVSFNPDIRKNYEFSGILHNSLVDCYNQVGYCSLIWESLK